MTPYGWDRRLHRPGLAEDLTTLSTKEFMEKWHVKNRVTVARWRGRLGIPVPPARKRSIVAGTGKRRGPPKKWVGTDLEADLRADLLSQSQIGKKNGLSRSRVSQISKSLGIEPRQRGLGLMETLANTHPELVSQVGVLSDVELARRLGTTHSTVRIWRNKNGISAAPPRKAIVASWIVEAHEAHLAGATWREIAARYGRTAGNVAVMVLGYGREFDAYPPAKPRRRK